MRGLSLIELMIAMAVGMFVLLAMTTIFVNNSQNRRELDKSASLLENGRYAMQVLRDELQMAGYYDALSEPPTTPANSSTVPCTDDLDVLRNSLGLAVIGLNSGGFGCLADEVTTTGVLFIQRAATSVAAAPLNAQLDYLQVSFCGEEYEGSPFVLDKGDSADFTLRGLECKTPPTQPYAPVRVLLRRFLYIDANNQAGDGIPTLKRIDRGGTAEALVEGIEAMRFAFALDTNGDGSPDSTTESPANTDWPNVVGVRIWLLARAVNQTTGYADAGPDKTFQLGSLAITPEDDDNFKRHVLSSYVELINPAGRRQQ